MLTDTERNPYAPPNRSGDRMQHSVTQKPVTRRPFATICLGFFAMLPLVGFVIAIAYIRDHGWPESSLRSALFVVLLSMFWLAFASLVLVAVGVLKSRSRLIWIGFLGVAASVFVYVPTALYAEGYFS